MIVAIIPARGGSKTIPKKNIIDFFGKPLLAWSIEQAKNSKTIDKIYVSTDDDEIAAVSKEYGAEVVKRPPEISGDFARSEDALKHAIGEIRKNNKEEIEYVVFLQATSPLRIKDDIDSAVKKIKSGNADSLFSGAEIGDFFIWGKEGNQFKSLNYNYKDRKMKQEFGKQFVENGSVYVFKPAVLMNYSNRLGGKISIHEMQFWQTFEVDDYESLELCRILFGRYLLKGK